MIGGWLLHQNLDDLDFLVLFSSDRVARRPPRSGHLRFGERLTRRARGLPSLPRTTLPQRKLGAVGRRSGWRTCAVDNRSTLPLERHVIQPLDPRYGPGRSRPTALGARSVSGHRGAGGPWHLVKAEPGVRRTRLLDDLEPPSDSPSAKNEEAPAGNARGPEPTIRDRLLGLDPGQRRVAARGLPAESSRPGVPAGAVAGRAEQATWHPRDGLAHRARAPQSAGGRPPGAALRDSDLELPDDRRPRAVPGGASGHCAGGVGSAASSESQTVAPETPEAAGGRVERLLTGVESLSEEDALQALSGSLESRWGSIGEQERREQAPGPTGRPVRR